jgi:acetyl-CoA acetyltransferase
VFVVDAVRTPVGRIGGGLAQVRPDDLGATVVRALVERAEGLDPATVDDVHFGNGNGAGEENRNVGRMVALLAGLPTSVPGVTENRLCGSGLDAIAAASREIATGDAALCIAGGVESMSRAPWVVAKPEPSSACASAEADPTPSRSARASALPPAGWGSTATANRCAQTCSGRPCSPGNKCSFSSDFPHARGDQPLTALLRAADHARHGHRRFALDADVRAGSCRAAAPPRASVRR